MIKTFIILITTLGAVQLAQAANHIVLVPGFFNSVIPAPQAGGNPWKQPYFSQDIVRSLSQNRDSVWVVDNLNPLGGIQENGERLIRFLKQHLTEMPATERSKQLILIAHSAGGLYSLYAAAHSDLPISRLITLSTPYHGLSFLDNLAQAHIPVESLVTPFALQNLLGLMETQVQNFLSQLKLRRPLRLDVFAGYQPASVWTWSYHALSPPLAVFQALIQEPSDGIVSVRSSLEASALFTQNPSLELNIHRERLDLEHWELIANAELFALIGVLNIESLKTAQWRAYREILRSSGL